MDQVTRSSVLKSNTKTRNNLIDRPSSENLPRAAFSRSAFSRATSFIGNSSTVLLGAPTLGTPQLSINPHHNIRQVEVSEVEAMAHHFNILARGRGDIKYLHNGNIHISFSLALTDLLLDNFTFSQRSYVDFSKVTELDLSFCTKLTGEAFRVVSQRFPALKNLDLTGCSQLTETDLTHLANIGNLEDICLAGCDGLSKHSFQSLFSLLDNVKVLDLTQCPQIDDEVLASLSSMHQLEHLSLTACTQFTDAGMRELTKLTELTSLYLDQCAQISDVGLGNLHTSSKLKKLKEINLRNCPFITTNGVAALKNELKTLKIVNTDPLRKRFSTVK